MLPTFTRISNIVKIVIVSVTILGTTLGMYSAGKALIQLPEKFDEHALQAQQQTKILQAQLCIQIADHQHSDWTSCLTKGIGQ